MHLEEACVQERHMYLCCREPAWTRPQDPKRFYKDHQGVTFKTGTETIILPALLNLKLLLEINSPGFMTSKLHKAHLIHWKGPNHTRRPDPLTAQPCPRRMFATQSMNVQDLATRALSGLPLQVLWNSIFGIVWRINWRSSMYLSSREWQSSKEAESRREGTDQRRERRREKGNRSMSIADGCVGTWMLYMQKNRKTTKSIENKQRQ